MWSVSTEDTLDRSATTPEDHLVWLLDRLEPVADELRRTLAEEDLAADFFVFFGMEQLNSSWELSADTVRRVADLGASLSFDVYGNAYSGHS